MRRIVEWRDVLQGAGWWVATDRNKDRRRDRKAEGSRDYTTPLTIRKTRQGPSGARSFFSAKGV